MKKRVKEVNVWSMADLLFYGVLLMRLFPVLWMVLPIITWYAVSAILFIRLMAYLAAAVRYHRFIALHTWLNKLTEAIMWR